MIPLHSWERLSSIENDDWSENENPNESPTSEEEKKAVERPRNNPSNCPMKTYSLGEGVKGAVKTIEGVGLNNTSVDAENDPVEETTRTEKEEAVEAMVEAMIEANVGKVEKSKTKLQPPKMKETI
jgi:hypothetical protein